MSPFGALPVQCFPDALQHLDLIQEKGITGTGEQVGEFWSLYNSQVHLILKLFFFRFARNSTSWWMWKLATPALASAAAPKRRGKMEQGSAAGDQWCFINRTWYWNRLQTFTYTVAPSSNRYLMRIVNKSCQLEPCFVIRKARLHITKSREKSGWKFSTTSAAGSV